MDKIKDLRNLPMRDRQIFLDSFDTVLTDCDGVLWWADRPINGALETLKMLQRFNKKVIFVSNNTTRSVQDYIEKLRMMGYKANMDDIVTPTLSIVWYLKKIELKKKVFTVGPHSFIKVLTENGINVITGPDAVVEDVGVVDSVLSNQSDIDTVVMDFDINLNIIKMTLIMSLLKKKDTLFLVGSRDNSIPISETRTILGGGPFVDLLISHSGRTPIEYAKPSVILKDYIFSHYTIKNPERCIFIGDSLSTDMEFAELCGFLKLWINPDIDQIDSVNDIKAIPDYYLPNLGAMPTYGI